MKFLAMILVLTAFNAFAKNDARLHDTPSSVNPEIAYEGDIEPPSPEQLRQDMASFHQGNDAQRAPASVQENFKLPK